jgi:heat shock protein 5
VTAHEKGTGQKQTISITNDKGRLTKEEIEKMVADAEKFAETDKLLKDKIDARHQLENYLYQMRNTVEDKEKLANKIDEDDK